MIKVKLSDFIFYDYSTMIRDFGGKINYEEYIILNDVVYIYNKFEWLFRVLILTVQRLVVITSFKFINNKLTIKEN